MADDKKSQRAARALRFTVTSALLLAPLGGCGGRTPAETEEVHVNTGPVEEPRYAPNPGPDEVTPQPQGPQLPQPTPTPTSNPGPQETEVDGGMHPPLNAPNPGPGTEPTTS